MKRTFSIPALKAGIDVYGKKEMRLDTSVQKLKGVGPKAAQRIVLELKDKVAKNLEGGAASDTFVAASTATAAGNSNAADAVGALVMLGYSQSEAAVAVGKLDQTLSTEELIKQALKQLA